MSNKKSPNFDLIRLVLYALGIGSPGIIYVFSKSQNYGEALQLLAIYIFITLVSGFLYKIYKEIEDIYFLNFRNKFRKRFASIFSADKHRYFEYLIATNKYLDTRQIVGPEIEHHIVLEDIYIPINFGYYYPRIGEAKFELARFFEKQDSKDKSGNKFVIVGKPGSGKTTLLRFLTLLLASKNPKLKELKIPLRIPIYLTLEDYADKIKENSKIQLLQLVWESFHEKNIILSKHWLLRQLEKGFCVIFLDGLDQVADIQARKIVRDWVQEQMNFYSKNNFLITSRPHGYFSNEFIGVEVLITKDFTLEQIDEFINNWYLVNEKHRSLLEDTTIPIRAKEGASKLIGRLTREEGKDLRSLARNPLLLTMIVVVFSSRENLPGKRVELYEDMIEVNLDQRYRKFIALEDPLSRSQKEIVLRELAYRMMLLHKTRIVKNDLYEIIKEPLSKVSTHVTAEHFTRLIKEVYNILVEVEEDNFEFSHKTFQEYLASTYFKEENKQDELIEKITDRSWEETIRLYCAQTDATQMIEKCLNIIDSENTFSDETKISALRLASNVLNEARNMQPDIRGKLESVLEGLAKDQNPEKRALSAETKLSARIRFMKKLADNIYIDESLITISEYRLFLDEMKNEGFYYCPDHWECTDTSELLELSSIYGARPSDMQQFCDWVTRFDKSPTLFRLPQKNEASQAELDTGNTTYFIKEFSDQIVSVYNSINLYELLTTKIVSGAIESDIKTNHKLKLAYERAKVAIPTITEILSRIDSTPIGGGGGFKSKVDIGTGSLFTPEIDDIRENRLLMEKFEVFAKLLKLNLEQFSLSIFAQSNSDHSKWLPQKIETKDTVFDIGISLREFISSCKPLMVRFSFDSKTSAILDELLISSNLLQTRQWIGLTTNLPPNLNTKEFYAFLRWYIRIGLIYIINYSWKKTSSFDGFGVNKIIYEQGRKLLFDMFYLEGRIRGDIKPFEGIRITKEVRNSSR